MDVLLVLAAGVTAVWLLVDVAERRRPPAAAALLTLLLFALLWTSYALAAGD